MFIAAIIDEEETILPIVEGSILRIYDAETQQKQGYPNPALGLTEGRRGTTLRFAKKRSDLLLYHLIHFAKFLIKQLKKIW